MTRNTGGAQCTQSAHPCNRVAGGWSGDQQTQDSESGQSRGPGITLAGLAPVRRWVAWQTEGRGTAGKPTKVPYAPDGKRAKADDPGTWGTRTEAEARAAKLPMPFGAGGVGIELGAHGGLALGGIDLDTCRDEAGAYAPWAAEVVARFGSYAEVSPSGTGAKVLFAFNAAELPALRNLMGTEHGKQWKRSTGGDHPPAIELYLGNRYFAVTGQQLDGVPAALRQVPTEDIAWLIEAAGPAFAGGKAGGQRSREGGKRAAGAGDGSRSALAFKIAADVKRAGGGYGDFKATLGADERTAGWLAEKGLADGEREARRTWDHAGQPVEDEVLLTEHHVALAFKQQHKDRLRYCHDTGAWFLWTGTHWQQDRKHAAFSFARDLVAQHNREAEFKTQAITGKAAFAGGVERFARTDPALAVTADEWNPDPWLLGTPGGTVDLHTGKLQAARPDDYITKATAVAPAETADCPRWRQFMEEVTGGDAALVSRPRSF